MNYKYDYDYENPVPFEKLNTGEYFRVFQGSDTIYLKTSSSTDVKNAFYMPNIHSTDIDKEVIIRNHTLVEPILQESVILHNREVEFVELPVGAVFNCREEGLTCVKINYNKTDNCFVIDYEDIVTDYEDSMMEEVYPCTKSTVGLGERVQQVNLSPLSIWGFQVK